MIIAMDCLINFNPSKAIAVSQPYRLTLFVTIIIMSSFFIYSSILKNSFLLDLAMPDAISISTSFQLE